MKIKKGMAVAVPLLVCAAAMLLPVQSALAQNSSSSGVYATATTPQFFARSGWYVGADLGAAFNPGLNNWNGGGFTSAAVGKVNTLISNRGNSSVVTGGLFGGYQYKWPDYPLAGGIEVDFNGLGNFRKNENTTYVQTCTTCLAPPGTYSFSTGRDTNFFGTVRGHFAYLPEDDMEIYISGGFAYAGNSGAGNGSVTYTSPTGAVTQFQRNGGGNSRTGSVIGAGFSYAFMDNWAVRIEGMYIDLKSEQRTFTVPSGTYTVDESVKLHFTVVRVGVTYKF